MKKFYNVYNENKENECHTHAAKKIKDCTQAAIETPMQVARK